MKKRIIIMAIAAVFAAGCSQRSGAGLSPAETVEHFCTALAAGDFAKAASLCGSGSADSCIGAYRTAWEKAEKNDSSAMKIAAGILSGMEVQVTDVRKEGDVRTVNYTLTAPDGKKKEKTATLETEEGEWRIKTVTDRQ